MIDVRVGRGFATGLMAAVLVSASAAMAADAAQGKQAVARAGCWQCHGYEGQGGVAGPKIAPEPIPFDTFSAFVRTTSRQMPPYREAVLADSDLADIYAYLQSAPNPADPKSIPLLSQ